MKWRIRDIIDLEYLLYRDSSAFSAQEQEHLHKRDRKIFLDSVLPSTQSDASPDRQFLIRTWLNRRREEEKIGGDDPPGLDVESLLGSARVFFSAAGLVLGAAAGASFLTYTGDSPVNVFVYLAVFVLFQLLLLLMLLGLSLYRLSARSVLAASPLYSLIARTILRVQQSAGKLVSSRLSAKQRMQAEAVFGTLAGKSRAFGFLLFLPIFLMTQLFGIGANLGLLGSTLFKVATADIAFGWQSTIQMSPAAVHTLAQNIALPWSWAVQGDTALPSLSQVEGSRIILKEGIHHLSTPNLVSWWPFLCFAVLVYGLLPRLFLFCGAVIVLRRRLNTLDFRQAPYEQLLLRMTTPLVSTRGRSVTDQTDAPAQSRPPDPSKIRAKAPTGNAARSLLVLIPEEILASCTPEEIMSVVNNSGRYSIEEIIGMGQDYEADRTMIDSLQKRKMRVDTEILLIQEGWQPPIMEYIDFIKQLRRAVGQSPCIRIGLIGKPRPDTIFTPATEENLQIWTWKTAAIGDPCISCETLVKNGT